MKRFFIIFLLLTCVYRLSAQDFLKQPFLDMTLNDITMAELFEDNIDWNFFKSKFGTPISETLKDYDGEYKEKSFVYSGANFRFSNYLRPYDFRQVIVTSSAFTFTYDGLQIKVGNSISSLNSKFPKAYANRKSNKMFIGHVNGGVFMTIHYDSSSTITKIDLDQHLL